MIQTAIHYLGHASYSVLYDNWNLLIDPVFYGLGGNTCVYFNPPRKINTDKIPPVNAIYISHCHDDHFDLKTIEHLFKTMGKNVFIFCPDDPVILKPLRQIGFCNIKPLNPEETISIGPYTLLTTPSPFSPFKELGVVVITPDMVFWNQVDTAVDLHTIWKVKHKLEKRIDILFCPFQPLREYALNWINEISFPQKRVENLITKALAVDARYIVPSTSSLKLGLYTNGYSVDWSYGNSRYYPISKPQFIKLLKQSFPLVNTIDIEAGIKLSLQNDELIIGSSHFAKQTGERIHFCEQPHPTPPTFNLETLSLKDWDKIISHLKKSPIYLSKFMKKEFVYYLEYIKANNYFLVIEIKSKDKDRIFILTNRLQKIKEVSTPNIWDYWFQYNGAYLIKKIHNPNIPIFYYAFRNTVNNPNRKKPESVLSLLGYNEKHLVDGANCVYDNVHPLWFWPFTADNFLTRNNKS